MQQILERLTHPLEKRKDNLERALEHEAVGNSRAAFDCYQKAVDISPSIAFELIQVLKQENVEYIVAPYEADAQMTFLSMCKLVDAVITEDSDLIPFGCSRIIFKMDKFGQGVEFRSSMLEKNRDLDFTGFTKQMILEMCIFSGCDYLPSLPGMGLKRAHALIRKYKSYEKVTKHLRYSGVSIPPLYEGTFKKAIWAFQHQRVYDPAKEDIVHLSNFPCDMGEDLDFLGPWLPSEVVKGIAKGDLDPLTKLPFQVETESTVLVVGKSFSEEKSETIGSRKRLDLPVQKNVLTNYFCLASLQAKRKFRAPKFTPKVLMESSSPSPISPDSYSPGSDEMPLSSGTDQSQDSNDKHLEEDRLTNGSNKLLGLESYHCSVSPKPLEEHEIKLKCTSVKIREPAKRKVSTSPFFDNNEVAAVDRNKLASESNEDGNVVFDDHPVFLDEPNQTSFLETAVKKRKIVQLYDGDVQETHQLENKKVNSALSDQENRTSSSFKERKDENSKSFVRDISHINDYCGIAEKSMERFVSLIDSFKYNSSGSRASGLRAPLKEVRSTFSRAKNTPVDFSEFSYKPSKNVARIASSRVDKPSNRVARMASSTVDFSEFSYKPSKRAA